MGDGIWYKYAVLGTLKELSFEDAAAHVDGGGAFVDLRDINSYLDVHIPGTIALLYESGPGMASRARDCVPLEVPLVLTEAGSVDLAHAAASLRGKGFNVVGVVRNAINEWARHKGTPASTEVLRGSPGDTGVVLDVGDPGTATHPDALRIPIERLWSRVDELRDEKRVVVLAGRGVRAALAVGVLERAGVPEVLICKTRISGA